MQLRLTKPMIFVFILFVINSALLGWFVTSPSSSTKRQHFLLDEGGCVAARHFGLVVTPLESTQSCVLVADADLELSWIAVARVRINRTHVMGAQFRTEKE